jgi:hypothetical protein
MPPPSYDSEDGGGFSVSSRWLALRPWAGFSSQPSLDRRRMSAAAQKP